MRAAAAAATTAEAAAEHGELFTESYALCERNLLRLTEWEAHFGASTLAFGDEASHDWILEQVCEGCAPPV